MRCTRRSATPASARRSTAAWCRLRAPLKNGDQVDIITSRAQTPSPDWETFVVSGKAKSRIRRFVRTRQREQYGELGRQMLQKAFRQEGYEFTEKAIEGRAQEVFTAKPWPTSTRKWAKAIAQLAKCCLPFSPA